MNPAVSYVVVLSPMRVPSAKDKAGSTWMRQSAGGVGQPRAVAKTKRLRVMVSLLVGMARDFSRSPLCAVVVEFHISTASRSSGRRLMVVQVAAARKLVMAPGTAAQEALREPQLAQDLSLRLGYSRTQKRKIERPVRLSRLFRQLQVLPHELDYGQGDGILLEPPMHVG